MRRKTTFVVLTLALVALIVAAACGGSDEGPTLQPTSTPVPTTASQSETTAPDSGATGSGGEFTRLFSDPPTLDPALTSDTSSAFVVIEVFSGLVTIDPDLNIVPDIAERWDISNDERTFTFHLRQDVKFHDGKPVTAHDFKFSMERALDPRTESTVADLYLNDIVGASAKLKGTANNVSGIRALDDYTLEITIDAPEAILPGEAHLLHGVRCGPGERGVGARLDVASQRHGPIPAHRVGDWRTDPP